MLKNKFITFLFVLLFFNSNWLFNSTFAEENNDFTNEYSALNSNINLSTNIYLTEVPDELKDVFYIEFVNVGTVSINPKRSEIRKESTIAREAYFLAYTEEIKKVIDIPLMVTGGFRSRLAMETAINQGACEIVGIGFSEDLKVNSVPDITFVSSLQKRF